jgi:hypothetical protein
VTPLQFTTLVIRRLLRGVGSDVGVAVGVLVPVGVGVIVGVGVEVATAGTCRSTCQRSPCWFQVTRVPGGTGVPFNVTGWGVAGQPLTVKCSTSPGEAPSSWLGVVVSSP